MNRRPFYRCAAKDQPMNYCPTFVPFITAERDDYIAEATVIYRPLLI